MIFNESQGLWAGRIDRARHRSYDTDIHILKRPAMTFEETSLPKHPTIEKAFNELTRLDADDKYTTRGVKIARIVSNDSTTKDPDAIAAALLVPMASDAGARLLAQADIPPRVTEIVDAVFELGGITMSGQAIEPFYKEQDVSTRAVILASSTRMFEVMAREMLESLEISRKAGTAETDAEYLRETLQPLKKFSAMICKAETEETGLAQKCEAAVERIEVILSLGPPPASKASPAAPKP